MKLGLPDPITVVMVSVSAASYVWVVLRPDWRWWGGSAALVAVIAAILAFCAAKLNAQSFMGGSVHAAGAIMLMIGLGFGSAMQAVGLVWSGYRTLAIRGWGLVGMVAAITAFTVVLE